MPRYRRTRRDSTPRDKSLSHGMRTDTVTLSRVKFINKRVDGFAFSVLRRTGTGALTSKHVWRERRISNNINDGNRLRVAAIGRIEIPVNATKGRCETERDRDA